MQTYTQLSQKGLVTIPRKLGEDIGLVRKNRPLVKLYREETKIIIEPVQEVNTADIRVYSDREIKQFLKEDKLTRKEKNEAETYLKNLT